jgi:ATP-dependent DNA ligase
MRENVMLCYPFEEGRLQRWNPPYFLQRKLDGERCRALCHTNSVKLISSEGHEFIHLPHINEALRRLRLQNKELDGELYCHGMNFSDIHSICSRKVNPHPEYALMEYHIFDIIDEREQIYRLRDLEELRQEVVNRNCQEEIKVMGSITVYTLDTIMEVFEDYIADGYEGFILRNKSGLYTRKRSTMIMKFKPHKEDVYEIIGTQEEVSIQGKAKGALGAFLCRGDDSSTFAVGSGPALTREARELLWQEKENLVGQYLQVKYQNLTPGRGVPRFPVALRVLDLKGGKI